jgi:hypothetical protein
VRRALELVRDIPARVPMRTEHRCRRSWWSAGRAGPGRARVNPPRPSPISVRGRISGNRLTNDVRHVDGSVPVKMQLDPNRLFPSTRHARRREGALRAGRDAADPLTARPCRSPALLLSDTPFADPATSVHPPRPLRHQIDARRRRSTHRARDP